MCMMHTIVYLDILMLFCIAKSSVNVFKLSQNILTVLCKTPLKTIFLRKCLFLHIGSCFKSYESGNKGDYQLYQAAQNTKLLLNFDISTCKLWCAILLYMKGDCSSSLNIVNEVLSSIPPYALYWQISNSEGEQLYDDMFRDSDTTLIQRARKAWLFSLYFVKEMIDSVSLPMGIQIELYFGNEVLILSPFICAYYLQFLCYYEKCQYDRRDCALQQLVEVAKNPELCITPITGCNMAGHCLLLAGRRDQAREMFYFSYELSQRIPPFGKYNSALWYLQNYCYEDSL